MLDRMFSGASSMNGNASTWTPLSATTMHSVFEDAIAFSQNVNNWKLSGSLLNVMEVFHHAQAFNDTVCWSGLNPLVVTSKMFLWKCGQLGRQMFYIAANFSFRGLHAHGTRSGGV